MPNRRLFVAKVYKIIQLTCALVLISGCVTTTNQYYWGHYEDLIYDMYNKPGKATPEVQIEKLNRDLAMAENRGMMVAPGVYAHLGFMYAAVGDLEKAEDAFHEEKMLFPESAVLVDGMMARARSMNSVREHN